VTPPLLDEKELKRRRKRDTNPAGPAKRRARD
jgi:hypothetical protein